MFPHLFPHIKGQRGGWKEREREAGKEWETIEFWVQLQNPLSLKWSYCLFSSTSTSYIMSNFPLSVGSSVFHSTSTASLWPMQCHKSLPYIKFQPILVFLSFTFVQLLPFSPRSPLYPVIDTVAIDCLLGECCSLIRVSHWHQSNVWLLTSRVKRISYSVAKCLIYIPPLNAEQLGRWRAQSVQ